MRTQITMVLEKGRDPRFCVFLPAKPGDRDIVLAAWRLHYKSGGTIPHEQAQRMIEMGLRGLASSNNAAMEWVLVPV